MKSTPITAIKSGSGEVKLIRYKCKFIEQAVVNDVISTYDGKGTACILTNKNDEALRIMGVLLKSGIKAKLIQTNETFDIYNIAELRYFIKKIDNGISSPVISDELWNSSKDEMKKIYETSTCLPIILNLLEAFELSCERKYRTDFDMFLRESKLEDFYRDEQGVIFVSTIHKSKGREFDNVYMLLNNVDADTDEQRRKIYVGITRAKSLLHVHYNNDVFDNFDINGVARTEDNTNYSMPDEVILQLAHKDIYLDFFKGKKNFILKLRSGMKLSIGQNGMNVTTQNGTTKALVFSQKFRDEIQRLNRMGYYPYMGKIRFVLAWKGPEDEDECAIILPEVYFRKG